MITLRFGLCHDSADDNYACELTRCGNKTVCDRNALGVLVWTWCPEYQGSVISRKLINSNKVVAGLHNKFGDLGGTERQRALN